MFTGIIETTSTVTSHTMSDDLVTLCIEKPNSWELQNGQSIAINGVCLTVVSFDDFSFKVELVPETIKRTSFAKQMPQKVNLERAMLVDDRFEGHIVQGHVDTVGTIFEITEREKSRDLTISFDSGFDHLIVEKGSITIDGVSVTVVNCSQGKCSVALIPHTIEGTTLGICKEGDMVNLEFDIVGKYLTKHK